MSWMHHKYLNGLLIVMKISCVGDVKVQLIVYRISKLIVVHEVVEVYEAFAGLVV